MSNRLLVPIAVTALVAGGVGAGGVIVATGANGGSRTVTVQAAAAPSTGNQPAVATEGETGQTKPAAATVAIPSVEPASGAIDVAQIYREAGPGVVRIEQISQSGGGLGSGFVIDRDGYIVTNAHVVEGTGELYVSFSDNERVKARIVGMDLATDIAVVKVDLPASALKPIPLGTSDSVQVGDPVVAIGNPFGLDRTVTAGIVSAVSRQIDAPDNVTQIPGAIQTDAAINHGNSGGPLLNSRGEVIGVNSQINTGGTGDGNVGIGFAIPIDLAKSVVAQLKATGQAKHAWLGVQISEVDKVLADRVRLPVSSGVMVESVTAGGPAANAGLKAATDHIYLEGQQYAVGGDIIVGLDGRAVTDFASLREAMLRYKPGDQVTLDIVRDGGGKTQVQVTLGDLAKLQSQATQQGQQPQQSPSDPFAP